MMPKNIVFVLFAFFIAGPLAARNKIIKVACMGNSVTYGYLLKNPVVNAYPARLQQMLGAQHEVKNFGHSGATLLRHGHNPYCKSKEFDEAIDWNPDIAVIELGLNDTDPRDWNNYSNEFRGDYAWLLDTLRKSNPGITIFICLMPPIFNDHPRFRSGTFDWYWKIQGLLSGTASANHTKLIDLHTAIYDRPDLFSDAIHPNEEGAEILAKTVYSAITGDYGGLFLSDVFANDMVLQRDQPIPVFGSANAQEEVMVTFNHQVKKTRAAGDGKWKINFTALPAGGPYSLIVASAHRRIELRNIMMGDVWLCSGQSNMLFRLDQAYEGKKAIAVAANKNIRLYQFKAIKETGDFTWDSATLEKTNKLKYFNGSWQICSQETAASFSAVGYFFGRKIQREENIPVGLIQVAVGGSPIVSWMDRFSMESDPLLLNELYDWKHSDFIMPWVRERALENIRDSRNPRQRHPYEPCYNFEAGIRQLIRTPVKGIIWYQGESDVHNVDLYKDNFKKLIRGWRKLWNRDLPFYFVQLSSIDRPSWPYFRDVQRQLAKEIGNTAMVVSSDLGDSLNVHPTHKKAVGERLALQALRNTYHRNVVANGPEPAKAVQAGNKITILFREAKKLTTRKREELSGFEVMNENGGISGVRAEIRNKTVVLYLTGPAKITEIFYAYQPFTDANLENEAGLPASTFSMAVKYQ